MQSAADSMHRVQQRKLPLSFLAGPTTRSQLQLKVGFKLRHEWSVYIRVCVAMLARPTRLNTDRRDTSVDRSVG